MNDLIAFLNARLDEDEAAAEAVAGHAWYEPDDESRFAHYMDAPHIARHAPARVLRDVEGKRHMLNTIGALELSEPSFAACLLSELSLAYRDHPDYRQEWAPG